MITCPVHGPRKILPDGQRCELCIAQHNNEHVGKTRPRRNDRPLKWGWDRDVTMTVTPSNVKEAEKFFDAVMNDPIRKAQLAMMIRRPPGVSKERFNIACRAAGGEPMLVAGHQSVNFGLDSNRAQQQERSKALPKMGVAERIYVKPKSLKVAKYGRNSAFWGEREWLIFVLKYSRGYVVRTDVGDESSVFRSVGQLKDAIRQSGWEIVR